MQIPLLFSQTQKQQKSLKFYADAVNKSLIL